MLARIVDMTPLGSGLQVQPVSGGAALVLGPPLESTLPQPLYTRGSGQVGASRLQFLLRKFFDGCMAFAGYEIVCNISMNLRKVTA